jgi:hypothetical protein
LLVRCWAGCSLTAICAALSIQQRDIFYDASRSRNIPPLAELKRPDRVAIAFRFELRALDLRLRADRIQEAGQKVNLATMTDTDLDRALELIFSAYADIERAELFEHVADDLRGRDFIERMDREQSKRIA